MDIISVLMFDLQDITQDNVVMRDWAKCSIRSSSLNETQKKSYPIAILNVIYLFCIKNLNKLAKARETRKSPGSLSLKKFGPGKLWVKKVWAQNIFMDWIILRK